MKPGSVWVEGMGPMPTSVGRPVTEVLRERIAELEGAVNSVLDQAMDDICWMDVYATLGKLVGREFDPLKLPEHQFRRNCDRFTLDLYGKKPYCTDALTEYMRVLHEVAEEHRQAKALLDAAGYGVTGTPLPERLKEALGDLESLESLRREDILGRDD